jgi:hypothetical protein
LPPRLHLRLRRGGKSPTASSISVSAPAPHAGSGAVSPSDLTVQSSCGAVDAPQGERAGKGSSTYVHCIQDGPSIKDVVSIRVRIELYEQQVNHKQNKVKNL